MHLSALLSCVQLILICQSGWAEDQPLPQTSSEDSTGELEYGYPITRIFTVDDYQQHEQNWAVEQGPNGLIYVANGSGLMEWDGERWRSYESPNDTRLRDMTRWHDNRLYTGTINDIGYYDVTEDGSLAFNSLISDWSDPERDFGEIWSVTSNSRWVVFVSINGLFIYDGVQFHTVEDFSPGAYRVFSVDDEILIKQQDSPNLLKLTQRDGFRLDVVYSGLPEESFPIAIYSSDSSHQVVTAANGIWQLSQNESRQVIRREDLGDEVVIFSSFIDTDGYHYLGTLKHGLFVLNPSGQLIRNYTQEHGLGTNTILDINRGNLGNLWLSGAPAITQMVPPHRYSQHKTEDGSSDLSQLIDHQGRKFLVGFGIYVMSGNDNPLHPPVFKPLAPLSNDQAWAAISLEKGILFAMRGGIRLIQPDDASGVASDEVLVDAEFAYDIKQVPDTHIFYAATQDGLNRLERLEDDSWKSVPVQGVRSTLRNIAIINEDSLWVSAEDSKLLLVQKVDAESGEADVTEYGMEHGLTKNRVVPIRLEGTEYFMSSNGLLAYSPDLEPPFGHAKRFDGLFESPEEHVHYMHFARDQHFWINIENRRQRVSWTEDKWRVDDSLFLPLPEDDISWVHEESADDYWVVFEGAGAYTINLAARKTQQQTIDLQIRSVRDLESDSVYYMGHGAAQMPELTQDNNSIRIQFALPDFRSSSDHEYRTRLLGSSSNNWSDWSHESSKDYTLLAGGQYVFQVQGRNQEGSITQPSSLSFVVRPPWYLTQLAVLMYGLSGMLLLGIAVVLGSKWRKLKTHAKQQELRQLVDERTEALAEANRKLETLANSDGLTGLPNRRQFDHCLDECSQESESVSLVLIDVDHFKQFNDNHGHLAGDDMLKSLARILSRHSLPDSALAARFGGEEFALILPGVDNSIAARIASELITVIENELPVTVSMGVASALLNSTEAVTALIAAADSALYQAKEAGRNRVIAASA